MKIKKIKLKDIPELLSLEEEMYWLSEKWKKRWHDIGKDQFKNQITEYILNYPEGCFGVEKDGELVGSLIFTKQNNLSTIPYSHSFKDYFRKDGGVAYVTFFVVKKGKDESQIANVLYEHLEFLKDSQSIKIISVVIYSSPIELNILKRRNFRSTGKVYDWEVFPGINVESQIYFKDL